VPTGQGWENSNGEGIIVAPYHELDIRDEDAAHVTRWQPARVLAECKAKRLMVETYERLWNRAEEIRRAVGNEQSASARLLYAGVEMVLPLLALPYADHPDYREEWRP
jgi:hypothetical protein